jgi:hypothetical protein
MPVSSLYNSDTFIWSGGNEYLTINLFWFLLWYRGPPCWPDNSSVSVTDSSGTSISLSLSLSRTRAHTHTTHKITTKIFYPFHEPSQQTSQQWLRYLMSSLTTFCGHSIVAGREVQGVVQLCEHIMHSHSYTSVVMTWCNLYLCSGWTKPISVTPRHSGNIMKRTEWCTGYHVAYEEWQYEERVQECYCIGSRS